MARQSFEAYCYALVQAGLDHINQGISIFDKELRLVGWNRRFMELLDLPPRLVFRGSDFPSIIRYNAQRGEYGPGNLDELVTNRIQLAERFEPHKLERVRPSGQTIEINGQPLPEGGFVTVYTDVTETRRFERLIREQNEELERRVEERTVELRKAHDKLLTAVDKQKVIAAQLRRSEARLKLVIDNLPAGIAYWDRDLRCLFANRRYAAAFGLTKERIVGKRAGAVVGLATVEAFREPMAQARRGEETAFEHEMTTPDGRRTMIRTWLVPEEADTDGVAGFFVLSMNITRQKRAETAILEAAKMDAVGQLASGIAHDFNNLLTVVIGNLMPLLGQLEGRAEIAEYLEPAIDAARDGAKLTERLLTFARSQPLAPEATDVEDVLGRLFRLLRRSLPSDIEVATATRGEPFPARVDPHQLESALLNLAFNARDSMPRGGRLTFETSFVTLGNGAARDLNVEPGDYVRVGVRDTGVGMDEATRAQIFEPFFTTKESQGGSGLGLSMVNAFITHSAGALEVDSTPGAGTEVAVLLPRAEAEAERPQAPAGPAAFRADATDLALLVEDNDEVRAVVRRQLTDLGYSLIEATSAAEGLELLGNVPGFTTLVTDVVMPGALSGLDLAERARTIRPGLNIVLMTGYAGRERVRDLERCDFPVLKKPFDDGALAKALATGAVA